MQLSTIAFHMHAFQDDSAAHCYTDDGLDPYNDFYYSHVVLAYSVYDTHIDPTMSISRVIDFSNNFLFYIMLDK